MNSHQYLEGRRHAIDVLQSVESTPHAQFDDRGPVRTALDNLRESCKRMPAEYARGVLSVVGAVDD